MFESRVSLTIMWDVFLSKSIEIVHRAGIWHFAFLGGVGYVLDRKGPGCRYIWP